MNTIWLKLAGAVVVIMIVFVIFSQFTRDKSPSAPAPQQAEKPKDVYDSFAQDDKKFGVKFEGQDQPEPNTAPPAAAQTPQTPAAQASAPQPQKEPHFEKLPIEQEVEAQRIHAMALEEFKRSRLPLMTPKLCIDYCRQIIQKWPKSEYAYKAKLMLTGLPERHKETFKITAQETDVSSFFK
jgi:type IV secretory pathway VirB10-like protein